MALVTLTTCANSFEAELIKGKLASEDIPALLQGENINAIYGGIGALPISVLINEEDMDRAKEVIKEDDDTDGID